MHLLPHAALPAHHAAPHPEVDFAAGTFVPLEFDEVDVDLSKLAPLSDGAPARLRRALAVMACGLVAIAALPARGQEAPTGLDSALEQQVRTLAETSTRPTGATRVEVSIGQLDSRLKLAPCQRIEPFLPNNARLWGKSRIGLRCTQGTTLWSVYLPVTVKVYGRAIVVPNGAAANSVLTAADLGEAEVDLAEDFTPAFTDSAPLIGRTLAQSMKPGQTLRQGHVKTRQWFAAGDTVRVVANGNGFVLEGEGQALTNGLEGQTARVRTESGHVVTGQAVGERRVEMTP